MSKQTIEIEVEVPEGYEATGEYRIPRTGDWYLGSHDGACQAHYDFESFGYVILRKKTRKLIVFVPDPEGTWAYSTVCNIYREDGVCYSQDRRYRREEREESY